jgi:hypothetical protein
MNDPGVMHLLERMKPIQSAPALRTVNGVGLRLCGKLMLPGIRDAFISAHWLVIFFLPIVPLGLYVVSGAYPEYRFHGRLSFSDVSAVYGQRAWWLLASAWIEGAGILVVVGVLIAAVVLLFSAFRR